MSFQFPNSFIASNNCFFETLYRTLSYTSPKILVNVGDSPGNQYGHKRIESKTGKGCGSMHLQLRSHETLNKPSEMTSMKFSLRSLSNLSIAINQFKPCFKTFIQPFSCFLYAFYACTATKAVSLN